MSTVMMLNMQKYCQNILQVLVLFLGLLSFPDCMHPRLGTDLTGGSRIGRNDAERVLSQYILWKQNKLTMRALESSKHGFKSYLCHLL